MYNPLLRRGTMSCSPPQCSAVNLSGAFDEDAVKHLTEVFVTMFNNQQEGQYKQATGEFAARLFSLALSFLLSRPVLTAYTQLDKALDFDDFFKPQVDVHEQEIAPVRCKILEALRAMPPSIVFDLHDCYGRSTWSYQDLDSGPLVSWTLHLNQNLCRRAVSPQCGPAELTLILAILMITIVHEISHFFVRFSRKKESPAGEKYHALKMDKDVGFWVERWAIGGYVLALGKQGADKFVRSVSCLGFLDQEGKVFFAPEDFAINLVNRIRVTRFDSAACKSARGSGLSEFAEHGTARKLFPNHLDSDDGEHYFGTCAGYGPPSYTTF